MFDSPVLAPLAAQLAPVRAFFEASPVYLAAALVGLVTLPLALLLTKRAHKEVRGAGMRGCGWVGGWVRHAHLSGRHLQWRAGGACLPAQGPTRPPNSLPPCRCLVCSRCLREVVSVSASTIHVVNHAICLAVPTACRMGWVRPRRQM